MAHSGRILSFRSRNRYCATQAYCLEVPKNHRIRIYLHNQLYNIEIRNSETGVAELLYLRQRTYSNVPKSIYGEILALSTAISIGEHLFELQARIL